MLNFWWVLIVVTKIQISEWDRPCVVLLYAQDPGLPALPRTDRPSESKSGALLFVTKGMTKTLVCLISVISFLNIFFQLLQTSEFGDVKIEIGSFTFIKVTESSKTFVII